MIRFYLHVRITKTHNHSLTAQCNVFAAIVTERLEIVGCCLTQTSKEYFHSLGDTVTLLCTLQKETNPITWGFQFNTTFIIQYSTNNQVNPNLEGISGRLSIVGNYDLQISTIEKNDEGTYKCGTNINGQLRQHFATLSIVSKYISLNVPKKAK
ncbi:unnamed protein product [Mytilus coruscus]|uniref:Ig-like domain-containing protein n=1 Tax=Mytilus coruscus TaxID=42192 RepID=A0A6J8CH22_MYTCO|nr:unnamed protein product [Mytilus coruscus]